jgi:hypothetical protein
MINNELDLELDLNWIDEYNKNLKKNIFSFIEPQKNIKIINLYIENKKIIYYHKYKIEINNKKIENEKILNLIEKNKKVNNKKFKLIDILKFELDIELNNIDKLIKKENKLNLIPVDIYKDIYFKDTINIFKNLQSLFFIYEIDKNNKKILTRRSHDIKHNITKKYY